jgi:hypothetical protein
VHEVSGEQHALSPSREPLLVPPQKVVPGAQQTRFSPCTPPLTSA